jgi:hypothetical protein
MTITPETTAAREGFCRCQDIMERELHDGAVWPHTSNTRRNTIVRGLVGSQNPNRIHRGRTVRGEPRCHEPDDDECQRREDEH